MKLKKWIKKQEADLEVQDKNMRKGHFIVIDGADGSGKATQVRMLQRKLQMKDHPHHIIAFPRYTGNPYGMLIGRYLKGEFGQLDEVNTFLVSLAYAGDRFLAKPMIQGWLNDGELVIADRYASSNKAYMSAKLPRDQRQEFIDWLDDLEYNINGIPREELVIFLYLPPKQGKKLLVKRKSKDALNEQNNDIHERNEKYQEESIKQYMHLAKEENWIVVNCLNDQGEMRTRDDIHKEIWNTIKKEGIME